MLPNKLTDLINILFSLNHAMTNRRAFCMLMRQYGQYSHCQQQVLFRTPFTRTIKLNLHLLFCCKLNVLHLRSLSKSKNLKRAQGGKSNKYGTFANEWRFDEGCEKSPSEVNLAFFSGTSSLRNKTHALQL